MRHNNLLIPLALFLAVPGCSKKGKKADDTHITAVKEIVSTGALEKLAAPAGVVAFGGADSAGGLVTALSGSLGPMGAMLSPATLQQGIEKEFHLPADSVDLAKPVRVVLVDPKGRTEPLALAVATKAGRAAFEKALPADKKKDDAGNAWSLGGTYLNFIDDYAVLTHDKELFGKEREFVKQLLGAKPAAQASLVVSLKNLVELYGKELDANVAMLSHMPARPGMNPAQIGAALQGAVGFVRQLDAVTIGFAAPASGLALTFDGTAKPGTDAATMIAGLKPGKLALLARVPKDAAFAMALSMDTDHVSSAMKALMKWGMSLAMPNAGDKLAGVTDTLLKAMTGEVAYAGYRQPNGAGLTIVTLSGVRDAAEVKKGWDELASVYKDPGFVDQMKKSGIFFERKQDAYKVGKVGVTVQEMKLDTKSLPLAQQRSMATMMSTFGQSHYAVSNDLAIVAMGGDPKSAMQDWLNGKVAGGFDQNPGLVAARTRMADNAFALAYASVGSIGSMFGAPGATASGDSGIALSLGQKDGALRIVLDVPSAQIQQLVPIIGSIGGRMH